MNKNKIDNPITTEIEFDFDDQLEGMLENPSEEPNPRLVGKIRIPRTVTVFDFELSPESARAYGEAVMGKYLHSANTTSVSTTNPEDSVPKLKAITDQAYENVRRILDTRKNPSMVVDSDDVLLDDIPLADDLDWLQMHRASTLPNSFMARSD